MMIIIWMWWIKGLVGRCDRKLRHVSRLKPKLRFETANRLTQLAERAFHLNVCMEHNLNLHHSPPLRGNAKQKAERRERNRKKIN